MPSHKRSQTEVKFDILRVLASGEHKPTRVMGLANLPWNALQRYLGLLESSGLIIKARSGDFRIEWSITDQGRRALEFYEAATVSMTS